MTENEKFVILGEVMKNKSIITSIIILIFAIFAAGFIAPEYCNSKIEQISNRLPFDIDRRIIEKDFELGLDLRDGAHLLYEADLSKVEEDQIPSRMEALRDLIEKRVNNFGIGEPLVQVRGERLVVELPGVKNQQEAIDQIGETPFLEFKIEKPEEELNKINSKREEVEEFLGKPFANITPEEIESLEGEVDNWNLAFDEGFEETGLTGRFLQDANISLQQVKPAVNLEFDDQGAEILQEITKNNVNREIATYLDEEVIQVATIQEEIAGGRAQISGNLSATEARDLAQDLKIGALPVPIELISQRSIGPALGQESLEKSVKAGIVGFMAVIVFMIVYYKFFGLLASVSLLTYTAFVLVIFKLISVTLTLSGIAGFVLSIGMAIDANILIFSRIKEELAEGKTFKEGIEEGFSRAWPSIRDGNLTTIVVALILFFVATSFVQGFATVLIIGILVSLFTSMIFTKNMIRSFLGSKLSEIRKIWL